MYSSTFYGVIEINLIMLLTLFRTDNNWSYPQWEWRLYASITGKQINEPNEHEDLPSVYFYLLLIAKSQRTALFTNSA